MITIYKYPNRRLYLPSTSSDSGRYITLADVENLVLVGSTVEVLERKTQSNVTVSILLDVLKARHTRIPRLSASELMILVRRV